MGPARSGGLGFSRSFQGWKKPGFLGHRQSSSKSSDHIRPVSSGVFLVKAARHDQVGWEVVRPELLVAVRPDVSCDC